MMLVIVSWVDLVVVFVCWVLCRFYFIMVIDVW